MKNNIHHILVGISFFLLLFTSCSSSDDIVINVEQQQQEEVITDPGPDDDDMDDMDDNNSEPLEALVLTDVSYGDNAQQVYDLYLPEGRLATKTKVVVIIHGGGWTSGDKDDMAAFVQYFSENHPDHAILNLNYVLAQITGPAAFPNQYQDVEAAINQIIAQSDELQVLPEFGFLGASAGAHLAMMYDYTYDTDDLVKFVINIVGPSDFTDPFFADDPNFPLALSLLVDESQFPAGTDFAVANSPALVASASSSPTLLFYGDQDPIVPLSNGQTLADNLDLLNLEHAFTIYEGGHGDDWSDADLIDLGIQTGNYVNTYLSIE